MMADQNDRQTGVVKWFDAQKNYGFIEPESGGKDIFVHANDLNLGFGERLSEGDRVEFTVKEGDKGLNAVNVSMAGATSADDASSDDEADMDTEPAAETEIEADTEEEIL